MVDETEKSDTGFDSYHLVDDPLWQTDKVKHLVHGRPKKTKEEQAQEKRIYLREYYRRQKAEKDRLEAAYAAGEITQEEYEKGSAKCRLGWYKTVAETQEIAEDLSYFRGRFRDIFAQDPPNQNPFPYEWPTKASTDAYQTLLCLCMPVHYLVQLSDPTTRNVQITLKTALSPDKDYLNDWMPRAKRESVSAIFNSSCDIMNATVNSMDRASKRQFETEWIKQRDQFIFSLTGKSQRVPPFVCLDLMAFAWADEGGEDTGKATGADEDEVGIDKEEEDSADLWASGLAGKLGGMSL